MTGLEVAAIIELLEKQQSTLERIVEVLELNALGCGGRMVKTAVPPWWTAKEGKSSDSWYCAKCNRYQATPKAPDATDPM